MKSCHDFCGPMDLSGVESAQVTEGLSYEAEAIDNTLSGSAVRVNNPVCSGGAMIAMIGNNQGSVTINNIDVPVSGSYGITICYISDTQRSFFVSVNGEPGVEVVCPVGSLTKYVSYQGITVKLKSGINNILFYNNNGPAPDLDRIIINKGKFLNVSGAGYNYAVTNALERPSIRDYTKSETTRMILSKPDGNGGSIVIMTFDQALEKIRQADIMDRGINKIVYLVGWQYFGNGDKYPAFFEVNPELKREQDATALDSLKWLMNEAKQYNTVISLQINMSEAYMDSSLWGLYTQYDVIAKNENGTYTEIGVFNGETAYQISWTREWESGLAKKRIDLLYDRIPIKEAGTIYIDAFIPREDVYHNISIEQEEAAQRKIFRYWRDKGIDVTSEYIEQIGLQPMVWWYDGLAPISFLRSTPATLLCGGEFNSSLTSDAERKGFLYGESAHQVDNWSSVQFESGYLKDFCTKTLPFYYLNRYARVSFTNYSDSLIANTNTVSITKNGNIKSNNRAVVSNGHCVNPPILRATPSTGTSQTVVVTMSANPVNGGTSIEYRLGPDGIWTIYTAPIVIHENMVVYGRAVDYNGKISDEANIIVNNVAFNEPPSNILNGTLFADVEGNPINAHGGCLIKAGNYYYWYGEHRDADNYFVGVGCYRSTDLKKWENMGDALNKNSAPELNRAWVERPKVIYNPITKQYVMWMHWENGIDYGLARAAVAYCDTPDGNFTYTGSFRPLGYMSRDCTLFVDDDGSAYFISASDENATLNVYKLTADYRAVDSLATRLFVNQYREAPCMFKRNGYYYLVTSGTSGWFPNQGKYAYSTNLTSGWSDNFNFGNSTTYASQPAYVFPIFGTVETTYLYTGDRWGNGFGQSVDDSQYVWLPITFKSNTEIFLEFSDVVTLYPKAGVAISKNYTEFTFKNRVSGKVLSVVGSSVELAADIIQLTDSSISSQRWQISYAGDGGFKFINVNSGLLMGVENGSTADGAIVEQFYDGNFASQHFVLVDLGNGYYKIKNVGSEKVLAPGTDGTSVVQVTSDNDTAQQWEYQGVSFTNNYIQTYSDGVISNANTWTITDDGNVVRINNDIFMPALWIKNHREIIIYSEKGYWNKTWKLPSNWSDVKMVDIYRITQYGYVEDVKNLEVVCRYVTISLFPGQAWFLVPAGTCIPTIPEPFTNLALNRVVTASSYVEAPGRAVDGSYITSWVANGATFPQRLKVDLGKTSELFSIKQTFREMDNTIFSYMVEGSNDDKNWTLLVDWTYGVVGRSREATVSGCYRYVRLTITNMTNNQIANSTEFEVMGIATSQQIKLPQSQMTAIATSQHPGNEASKAIDGNINTFWEAEYNPPNDLPQSVTINLGGNFTVSRLTYLPRQDNSSNGVFMAYNVYVSNNGITFTKVASGTWPNDKSEKSVSFTPINAAYVNLEATEAVGGFASAAEINVYALYCKYKLSKKQD